MRVDGIDFNVTYWKGKTKKQFVSELLKAYPDKDLEGIYYQLFPKAKKEEVKVNNEGAE